MKRGTPRHPKMYTLAEILKIPLPHAVGILEMLWHHAAEVTPQGDIGSLPDRAIAAAVEWRKPPAVLVGALHVSGWIDADAGENGYRYRLHDWPEHCEQSVVKLLEYRNKDFLEDYGYSLENRKRKSRVFLPSREAEAKAKAKAEESSGTELQAKTKTSTRDAERFSEFWLLYWRKVSRSEAAKAYRRHVFSEEIHELVLGAIRAQAPTELAKEAQFRPHAATWLNQHRWENEPDPQPNGTAPRYESAQMRAIREACS